MFSPFSWLWKMTRNGSRDQKCSGLIQRRAEDAVCSTADKQELYSQERKPGLIEVFIGLVYFVISS